MSSWNDDSIGEIISGSSGAPSGFFAHYALFFPASNTNQIELHDIRSSFAHNGLGFQNTNTTTLWNIQIYNCDKGIEAVGSNVKPVIANALLYKTRYAFSAGWLSNSRIDVEHGTVRSASQLFHWSGGANNTLNITNSLVYAVTNASASGVSSNYTTGAVDDTGIFAGAGRGTNYLATGSPHKDAGTTGLTSRMLAILRETTTEPPIIRTNDFEEDTTLYPHVMRDTDTPDLGAHFYPLDYAWGNLRVWDGKTLILTNGVAVGVHSLHGTKLNQGAAFISEGTPLRMNRYLHPALVQELPVSWNSATGTVVSLLNPAQSTGTEPQFSARFTEFATAANSTANRYFVSSSAGRDIRLTDCVLRNMHLLTRLSVAQTNHGMYLTNNYLHRPYMNSIQVLSGTNNPGTLQMWNNLVYGGTASFNYTGTGSTWAVYDNLFDAVSVTQTLTSGNNIPNDYNAYFSTTQLTGGANNKTLGATDYVTGPLGGFYYPTSGTNLATLINTGSRNATNAGLFHFTTLAATGTKETNSVVDIGFHYVGVDASSFPADTDGDGVPDYLEDRNGDGTTSGSETDRSAYNSANLFTNSPAIEIFTPVKKD